MFCSQCGVRVPDSARFCPSCGAVQSSVSQMPTAVAPTTSIATTPSPSAAAGTAPQSPTPPGATRGTASYTTSGLSSTGAAYHAGDVLADRYRIIGLLGRGGMGEVYRADDLKLGQEVSLKFLGGDLANNPTLLERFHAEVRNARHVSHPNVCRVFDIAEFGGRPFITMEYVDGEDLATLLRRIGRLPKAKADEVARQICAGLAAAHDRGVLHRDLKPSNVMIDGNGHVRITDFGLAVRAGEDLGEISGTPAYMSPEQFEGKPATVKSDLYSTGLILYEIYTGKRAFDASTFADWKSKHTTTPPTNPSEVDRAIDADVERAILRCLEKEPSRRPSSAIQLAAALPGGDPLAAAIAAGETPSPEMVAAAGGEGALAPRVAWSLLGGLALAIAAVLAIGPSSSDLGLSRMRQSPEVLRDRAHTIATQLSYDANPVDSDMIFGRLYEPIRYLADRLSSRAWRRELGGWGPPITLIYRQSPRLMVPGSNNSRVVPNDPPLELSGQVLVFVDAVGRLVQFEAVPPQFDSTAASAAPDWNRVFALAGLDPAAFTEVAPRWVSPQAFDTQAEWTGTAPWMHDIPVTVSAAAWRGKPVYFEVQGPWSQPRRMSERPRTQGQKISDISFSVLFFGLLVAGLLVARRNLRLGRGDSRGAARLATFTVTCGLLQWAARAHHVPDVSSELNLFLDGLGAALVPAVFLVVIYLAVEPYVRRHVPELLIGWARVLEGRLRDPRVGRDVLVGALLGTVAAVTIHLVNGMPSWFEVPGQTTMPPNYDVLRGGRFLLGALFNAPFGALGPGLFFFGLYFLLRVIARRPAIATTLLVVIGTLTALGGENAMVETPGAVVFGILMALTVTRFGLLAIVVFALFQQVLTALPMPLDFAAPYAASSLIVLLLLIGIAVYAFRIALGSRPVFRMALDA